MNGSSLTARFLSLLLILLFVALSAGADGNETYLAWNGSGYTETVIPHEAAVLTAQDTSWSGWYRASGSLSISRRVTVNGDASLILMDSCTLTIPAGITVNSGASLTIYAQSDSAETAGKLLVTAPSNYDAGIGGTQNHQTGTILIRGGRIESTGKNGAAIGGASGQDGGVLEISGGTVVAVSLDGGAAIGGGINKSGGEITILSGTVEAVGYTYSAGIGGGNNGGSGTVTIRGGTVTASGGYGAAIGSGYTAKTSGTILIQSGRVTATSSSGAAIGGGQKAAAGTIRIENGVISAAAANGGAGIGLGDSGKDALIELSWTDASCSIHASTYRGEVTMEKGFRDEQHPETVFEAGTLSSPEVLDGLTLIPHAEPEEILLEQLLQSIADYRLPGDLEQVGELAFTDTTAKSIYVPDGCQSVGAGAFSGCRHLIGIRLPRDCSLPDSAFTGCDSLQFILAPAGGSTEVWAASHQILFVPET